MAEGIDLDNTQSVGVDLDAVQPAQPGQGVDLDAQVTTSGPTAAEPVKQAPTQAEGVDLDQSQTVSKTPQPISVLTGKPIPAGELAPEIQAQSPEPTKGIVGLGEAALQNVTGVAGGIVGLAGTWLSALAGIHPEGKRWQEARDAGQKLSQMLTYEPRSEEGKKAAVQIPNTILLPVTAAAKAIGMPFNLAAKLFSEHPEAVAALQTAGETAQYALTPKALALGGAALGARAALKSRNMIEDQGLVYKGSAYNQRLGETIHMYTDPITGTSNIVRPDQMNPTDIAALRDRSREAFGITPDKVGDARITAMQKGFKSLEDTTQRLADRQYEQTTPMTHGLTATPGATVEGQQQLSLGQSMRPKPVKITIKQATGRWMADIQETAIKLSKNIDTLWKDVPDDTRKAITHYREAYGRLKTTLNREPSFPEVAQVLQDRAEQVPSEFKPEFEAALELTPAQVGIAKSLDNHYNSQWYKAIQSGVVDGWMDGYANHLFERGDKTLAQRFFGNSMARELNPTPGIGKEREFPTYFDAIMAGKVPKNTSADFLQVAYDKTLMQAIAGRNYIRDLFNTTMDDGKPAVVVLNPYKQSDLVLSDGRQYELLNNPVFRNWDWEAKDVHGRPITGKGNVYVHPDASDILQAQFGESRLRKPVMIFGHKVPLGDVALRASSWVKGTILVGPFHLVHTGQHYVAETMDAPWRMRTVEDVLSDPKTGPILREGMRNGLFVTDRDAMRRYGEGLVTGGLWHNPIFKHIGGDALMKMGEFTFEKAIPEMIANGYVKVFGANMRRYAGQLSRDQIAELSAKQMGNAFGFQNEKYLAAEHPWLHSQTMLDAQKLFLLAPEFLKSRIKYTVGALTKHGAQQRVAMLRTAITLWSVARVANLMSDGDPHLETPFGVVVNLPSGEKQEFTMRNVIADAYHAYSNPSSFVWARLNPVLARPAADFMSLKYRPGTSLGDMISDLIRGASPNPVGTIVGDPGDQTRMERLFESIAQSASFSNWPYKSPAEEKARDYYRTETPPANSVERDRWRAIRDVERKIDAREISPKDAITQLTPYGLQPREVANMFVSGRKPELQKWLQRIKPEEAMDVWGKMNAQEKDRTHTMMIRKVAMSRRLTPQDRMKFMRVLGGLNAGQE